MIVIEKALSTLGLIKSGTRLSPVHAGYNELLFDSSGGAITIYRIYGALRRFEGKQRERKLQDLERYLGTWNSRSGYYMTFIHEHSADGLQEQIKSSHDPMRATMRRIKMPSAEHMLNSREEMLDGKLHYENLYLVLHTTTAVLPAKERDPKKAKKWGFPVGQGGNHFTKLHDMHAMYETQMEGALDQLSIQYYKLNARDGASLIGSMWKRRKIRPEGIRLVGDHITAFAESVAYRKTSTGYAPIFNLQDMAYPSLSEQLFDDKIYFPAERDDFCQIGGNYQASLKMVQAPGGGSVKPYNDLRKRLSADTNYRLSIQLASGSNATATLAVKRIMALMLAATNTQNLEIAKSIEELDGLQENGVSVSGVRIMCATWARDTQTLERNVDKLHGAFQFWGGQSGGGARLVSITDNPEEGVAATLPGAIMKGPMTFMPIGIISEILPIEMTTSPWAQGLIMRSGADQAYPLDPGDNALLDFHVYVLIGGTGKGKSVTMTELIKACLFRGGLEGLPHVRYLDVGYTSKALFTYLRYMLPEARRHEIVHYTIQNTPAYALNLFDTPLGMREPPPQELSFMADTVGSFLSGGAGAGMANSILRKLGSLVVKEAYRLFSDTGRMARTYYHPDKYPELVEAIKHHGIEVISGKTLWYHIGDALFDVGEIRMASIAQRHASPTLPDLLGVISSSTSIQEAFKDQEVEGTGILNYAVTTLQSMIESFPALSGATQLDIETAKMIGIDMQDVANSSEETNLFYMILQNVLSRGFMTDPDEISRLNMPDQYREYHRKRIRELRSADKLFAFDELHRLSVGLDNSAPPPRAMMLLMRWIKEVRKYGIRLLLSTQSMDHMPPEIKGEGMWSLFFCMGVDAIPAQEKLVELFDISEYGQHVLTQLNGPIPGKGAPCLFLANTKFGMIEQDLYIVTSAFELWAAPTKASNLELMQEAISKIGDPILTARALTNMFPKGSAESELRRLMDQEDKTTNQAKAIIVNRVIEKAENLRLSQPDE
ncbi:hypothetical protein VRRI112168_00420 [Vreelandella rituensis]|uniref:Uncharacterized protein n=1 Tax=Vreelandella rituensis TaxID=2282306 RepID=A0A368U9E4_9GAMM|nr:hypothetical protein [Halomonas rituensis]RCV93839.1 hypothetical protein DU506_01390 [Halomonas rituensis]